MVKKKGYANGVYIQRIPSVSILRTGRELYSREEWNTDWNAEANGVAVISDNCEFVISPSDIDPYFYWEYYGILIDNIVTTTDESTAKKDYAGSFNTDEIIRTTSGYLTAAGYCKSHVFKHGKTGYLGSFGEWQKVLDNKSEIIACMSLMGGKGLNVADHYWTSTQVNEREAWIMRLNDGRVTGWKKQEKFQIRAFAAL